MSASQGGTRKRGIAERRTIDYIPEAERHGSVFSQFTLWLAANLQITAIVTGALAVVLGGDVFWSLVGLLIGQIDRRRRDGAARRARPATRPAADDLEPRAVRRVRRGDPHRARVPDVCGLFGERLGAGGPGGRPAAACERRASASSCSPR